jgi:MFS family permease
VGGADRGEARERLVTPTFALVTASSLAYFLGYGMLLPVLPRFVERVLDGGGLAVGFTTGAFAFTAAALRPFAGRIGDARGRRVLVLGGSAILGASYLLYLPVDGLAPLILLRVLSGVGEAAMFVGAATAIQDLAPAARRGEAASYFSVAVYGGLGLGPPIGEWLQRHSGYDAVWLGAACVTFVATVLGWWTPPGIRAPREGAARRRWLHPAGLGPGSVLALSLSGLAAFTGFVALYVDHQGLGDAGRFFALYGGLILAIRIAGARLADSFGARRTAAGAIACIVAGMIVLASWHADAGVYLGTSVFAVGMALQYPALIRLVIDQTPDHERSSAIATFSIFFDLSQGVGLFVLGAVVSIAGSEAWAFAAAAVLSASALAVLQRDHHRAMVADGLLLEDVD